METKSKSYLAYMLRLWQEQGVDGTIWRASLESPHTSERHGFASLESLFDFLRQRTRQGVETSKPLAGNASEESK